MKKTVKKTVRKFEACEIYKYEIEQLNKLQKRFKDDKDRFFGFSKIVKKGKYIMKETNKKIIDFIKEEYDDSIYVNLKRIYNNKNVTKEMKAKLDTWHKEGRTNERFLLDTVSSWLAEDFLILLLSQSKYMEDKYYITLNGTDKKRDIQKSSKCTKEPDIKLIEKKTNKNIYVEVMEDNYSFIKKTNAFDLRFKKYNYLKDLTKNKNNESKIAILDVKNKGFLLVDVLKPDILEYKYFNKRYGKYSTKLSINHRKTFYEFKNIKGITAKKVA